MPNAPVSPAGMRIVKLLIGNPPQTVADLIRATGVTRTAVTEQLNELVAGGFVKRSTERLPGRGRPRHLYTATEAALLLLFNDNQRLVAPAIWKAVEEAGGSELVDRVRGQVVEDLTEHYRGRVSGKTPTDRFRRLGDALREEGGLIEIAENNGHMRMYKRSCPFVAIADDRRCICAIDRDIMAGIVGTEVRKVACRHQGDPCCVFEIDTAEQ